MSCKDRDCQPHCHCKKICTETGRCSVRRQTYYLNACPENEGKHDHPWKHRDPVKLFIQDYGHELAPVIFFIDGATAPQFYEYQFDPLVEAGFRVIIMTPRGMGTSDKPGPGTPYNLDVWADDVHSVLKQLDVKDITLVGDPQNCRVALRYMTRHRCERISRFYAYSPNATALPAFIVEALKAAIRVDRENEIELSNATVNFPVIPTPVQNQWANGLKFQVPIHVWVALYDILSFDMSDELKCVCAPVLGIVGGGDLFTPVSAAQAFVDGVPKGKLIVVPGQGHALPHTGAAAFNQPLIEFARACDPCKYVKNFVPPVSEPAPQLMSAQNIGPAPIWSAWSKEGPLDPLGNPILPSRVR
jgi:non-heme chloroperoxidase